MIFAETITDADYADDLVLLANTSAQAESQLHHLKQTPGGINRNMKTNKTEFMCFKHILSGKHLKLINKFPYLGSNTHLLSVISIYNKGMEYDWQVINYMEIWSLWQNKTGFLILNA